MKKKLGIIFALVMMLFSQPMPIHAEPYYVEGDYILYIDEETEVGDEPFIGGRILGSVPEGVYYADAIKDNFYRLVGYDNTWVYKYNRIDAKQIHKMSNEVIELNVEAEAYTMPFEEEKFEAGFTFQPGQYDVSKKAFNWLLITDGTTSGWIMNKEGEATLLDSKGVLDLTFDGVEYKTQIIDYSPYKRVGFVMRPDSITIHNTANGNPDSDAQRHADLLSNPTARAYTSWHFTVDDHQIIQSMPVNEVGYHAGDGQGYGNGNSVAIEMCENAGGDWNQTVANTQKLVARLLIELNLTIDDVKQHKDFSGKNCPRQLMDETVWAEFLAGIQEQYDIMRLNDGAHTDWNDLGNGCWAYYEADGTPANRWAQSAGGQWYYIVDGIMQKNMWIDGGSGRWYYVGHDGMMLTNTWVQEDGTYYWMGADGLWVR